MGKQMQVECQASYLTHSTTESLTTIAAVVTATAQELAAGPSYLNFMILHCAANLIANTFYPCFV